MQYLLLSSSPEKVISPNKRPWKTSSNDLRAEVIRKFIAGVAAASEVSGTAEAEPSDRVDVVLRKVKMRGAVSRHFAMPHRCNRKCTKPLLLTFRVSRATMAKKEARTQKSGLNL